MKHEIVSIIKQYIGSFQRAFPSTPAPDPAQAQVEAQVPRLEMRSDFEIVILCALLLETDAITALFDHHWEDHNTLYGQASGDPNAYSTGIIVQYLRALQIEPELRAEYPGVMHDRLLDASYRYAVAKKSCEEAGCKEERIARHRLKDEHNCQSRIHFGLVASGDTVMKSAQDRDTVAEEKRVIAFEIESAGIWDVFPCIVIKGVCDYADSHKPKRWQRCAASTAAACTKAFLNSCASSLTDDRIVDTDIGASLLRIEQTSKRLEDGIQTKFDEIEA
ncbi:nucleoside phosphorylase domain-containing protein [Camillea tinctor]|nr:nucleoside phosphorylase domain-containing protein [Camillea tinctor]